MTDKMLSVCAIQINNTTLLTCIALTIPFLGEEF